MCSITSYAFLPKTSWHFLGKKQERVAYRLCNIKLLSVMNLGKKSHTCLKSELHAKGTKYLQESIKQTWGEEGILVDKNQWFCHIETLNKSQKYKDNKAKGFLSFFCLWNLCIPTFFFLTANIFALHITEPE